LLVVEQLLQAPVDIVLPLEEKPKDEKSFFTSLLPQSGHVMLPLSKPITSFSKLNPHFAQLNS